MPPSNRHLAALAVALFVGALRAVQLNVPEMLVSGGLTVEATGLVLSLVSLLALLASPFGVAAAGYLWGVDADVRRRWLPFAGSLVVTAVAGFAVVYLLTLVAAVLGSGHLAPSLLARVASAAVAGIGLVNVAFAGLAGAAVAEFRTGKSRNSSTVQA